MNPKKIIGICGGVGPMAGVKLHELIIQNTDNGGTDAGHLQVVHISRHVPDRTEFLLGTEETNSAEEMLETARSVRKAADSLNFSSPFADKAYECPRSVPEFSTPDKGKASGDDTLLVSGVSELVIGVPCNTFHAQEIWDRFLELIEENQLNVQIINMLEETAQLIKSQLPGIKKIGLMGTTGTRQVKVYNQVFEPLGFEIIEVPEDMQAELHDSVYNEEWGVKAVYPVMDQARQNFEKYVSILKEAGAEAIILGCTEIPLALPEKEFKGVPLIDPMLALARALIREVDVKKLKYTPSP